MEAYDGNCVPAAFGLHNTGAICYLNAFLQVLAGCPAFSRGVLRNAGYLRGSATGAAMVGYVSAYLADGGRAAQPPAPGIEAQSAAVLRALVDDLAARRPHVHFGGGQESASEALVHILDMMEPPRAPRGPSLAVESAESPITGLFLHRYSCGLHCRGCKNIVSAATLDHAVSFNLFHIDQMRDPPATAADFAKALCQQDSTTEGFRCPECPCPGCGARPVDGACPSCKTQAHPVDAVRRYTLTMVPEIIFCTFNLYVEYGGARRPRYFPDRLEFPTHGGGRLLYRLVGQIEHSGSLSGGHYWARGLRADGRVAVLNDASVATGAFGPSPDTYIIAYNYVERQPPQ
jgi:hypothetical protein